MKKGFVYLIGAGPGDPGLITLKALEAIENSDCLIYDFLANPRLADRPDCERIYVGKQGGDHTLPQEEISALMVKKALEGKTVARLKGGDPFIFGRGGEEAQELVSARDTLRGNTRRIVILFRARVRRHSRDAPRLCRPLRGNHGSPARRRRGRTGGDPPRVQPVEDLRLPHGDEKPEGHHRRPHHGTGLSRRHPGRGDILGVHRAAEDRGGDAGEHRGARRRRRHRGSGHHHHRRGGFSPGNTPLVRHPARSSGKGSW